MARAACGALILAVGACAGPPPPARRHVDVVALDPPAAHGAFAPRWAADARGPLLSWLEPLEGGGHRFVVSRPRSNGWTGPVEIARGDDFFANWADLPGLGVAGDGTLLAHWLLRTGDEAYAYSIALARSADGGLTWRSLGWLHDDGTPTEHGFVSWAPEGESARAVWLDGRAMAEGGPMSLRTALVGSTVGPAVVLDERVCECCSTGLAMTSEGPLAVYRDRSTAEVRDIALARPGEESAPSVLHADGWELFGCPVNGPAIDAEGERVVVAWFTGARGHPRVLVAFSSDGGRSFSEPSRVDGGDPVGRVDVSLDPTGGVVVTWLEREEQDGAAAVSLRRFDGDGVAEPAVGIGATAASRAAGFPRLGQLDGRWAVAWVDAAGREVRELHVGTVDQKALRALAADRARGGAAQGSLQ